MDYCLICGSDTHNISKHTAEEIATYNEDMYKEELRVRREMLRNAYDLVAKDIIKRPKNMLKLTKRLHKLKVKP